MDSHSLYIRDIFPPHPLFTKTLISLKITQDKSRFLAPCADNKQRLQLWKNSANSTGPLGAELREPQLQTTRLALFYPDMPGYTLNHVLKLSPHLTKLNARCSLWRVTACSQNDRALLLLQLNCWEVNPASAEAQQKAECLLNWLSKYQHLLRRSAVLYTVQCTKGKE